VILANIVGAIITAISGGAGESGNTGKILIIIFRAWLVVVAQIVFSTVLAVCQ
jgi:hypothetical protein